MNLVTGHDLTAALQPGALTGALTGREIAERFGIEYEQRDDFLGLWALCNTHPGIIRKQDSTRYLRIDRETGEALVTPAILREFADFTAFGLNEAAVAAKAREARAYAMKISEAKKRLAQEAVSEVAQQVRRQTGVDPADGICCLLAGDVAYRMSFDERREVNGEYVKGSDLDIIVLQGKNAAEAVVAEFDRALLEKKYLLLKLEREEIDYIVKDMDAVKRQSVMCSYRDMVALKIIMESEIIFGNMGLYLHAKELVRASGAMQKLEKMMATALAQREAQERQLLAAFAQTGKVGSVKVTALHYG